MSKEFERLNKKMIRDFSKDRNMALATSFNGRPTVRIIDAYYDDGAFYIVTHDSLEKMKQISMNRHVSLCTNMNEFQGLATNIGHPLAEENKAIREKLTHVFSKWYFAHNDESDPGMCYVKVELTTAVVYFNKIGYEVDFVNKQVQRIES